MAFCPKCGAELKPGAKFCENCGAQLQETQASSGGAAVPAQNAPAAPVQGVFTAPTAPAAPQPMQGSFTAPAAPAAPQPVQGAYTAPAASAAPAAPVQGAYTAPAAPAAPQPVQGSFTASAVPAAPAAPVQGSYTAPVQGSYTAPAQNPVSAPAARAQNPAAAPAAPAQGSYTASAQGSYAASAAPQGAYVPPQAGAYAPQYAPAAQTAVRTKKPLPKKLLLIGGIALGVVVLVIVLAVVLAGGGSGAAANDPNLGTWQAVEAEMSGLTLNVSELYSGGFTLELKAKGRCTITINGSSAGGKWTLADGVFTVKGGGVDCTGTLADGVLTLENVLDSGVTLRFTQNGVPVSQAAGTAAAAGKDGSAPAGLAGYYVLKGLTSEGTSLDAATLRGDGTELWFLQLNADGTGEAFMDSRSTVTWKADTVTIDGTAFACKLDGDVLSLDAQGTGIEFVRAVLPAVNGTAYTNPADLSGTDWHGWIAFSDYWGEATENDGILDATASIGHSDDYDKDFFEVFRENEEDPVISMWVTVDGDHITPIIDEEAWIEDHTLTADDADSFTLYPFNGTLRLMFPYTSADASWGCTITVYLRLQGDAFDGAHETVPPSEAGG